jgi:undecaprenyl diphosphate synthase
VLGLKEHPMLGTQRLTPNMPDQNNIPKHIAFIMDGNGRWAQKRHLPRVEGHRVGAKRIIEVVKEALDLGVGVVTFFAFSSENWSRPRKEIEVLMKFLDNYLDRQITRLHEKNIRFMVIGRNDPVPKYLLDKIQQAEIRTKDNTGMTMVLALNYGARQEITDAVKKIVNSILKGKLTIEDLDENEISRNLYTCGLPDPDLLVRTSGELRLSNFLLWQLSYSELYFPDVYWPDFGKEELRKAIKVYQERDRRFGNIDVIKKNN